MGRFVSRDTFDTVRAWQLGILERHSDRFRDRVAQGRVRDGHGDLRLEHVYFENGRADRHRLRRVQRATPRAGMRPPTWRSWPWS